MGEAAKPKVKQHFLTSNLLCHIMNQNLRSSPELVMSALLLAAINGL